jgi:hypothetical protein
LMIWATTWMEAAPMWMSRFLRMVVMIGIESLDPSFKFRNKTKFS